MFKINLCNYGFSRQVLLIGRYAIKMPYFQYSWMSFVRAVYMNLREVEIYRYAKENDPHKLALLCPIVRSVFGGIFLVMHRAETDLSEQDMAGQWAIFKDARLDGDDKCENYGRLDGRIVKLDYADCNNVWT